MARRPVVQPQSDLDIQQAAAVWYEVQRSGLGSRFLDELDLVFQRIKDNSQQFLRVEGDAHRALLRHVPYGVYFLWQDAEKVRQRRSRFAQRLNVPKRTPRLFVCCGLADGLFEHPALGSLVVLDLQASEVLACRQSFSAAC